MAEQGVKAGASEGGTNKEGSPVKKGKRGEGVCQRSERVRRVRGLRGIRRLAGVGG